VSRHDPCCVGAVQQEATTFFVLRRELAQKRVFCACQPIRPGEGPEAQINNAAKEFDITYDEAWRAWHGRASMALCDKMDKRWPAVEARQREYKARALAEFILEMETALAATRPAPLETERLFGLARLSSGPALNEA
jgi:Fe-S cluster biosynthesis and repair protein YggX